MAKRAQSKRTPSTARKAGRKTTRPTAPVSQSVWKWPRMLAEIITRRRFGQLALSTALGVTSGLLSQYIYTRVTGEHKRRTVVEDALRESTQREVEDLFADVFLRGIAETVSVSCGRKYQTSSIHPDNKAVGRALVRPLMSDLGLTEEQIVELEHQEPVKHLLAKCDGDTIFVGGPNSTPLTRLAFEFEGPDDYHQRRPEDRGEEPILPLAYYTISDEDLVDMKVAWLMESVGVVSGWNWPMQCRGKHKGLMFPDVGNDGIVPATEYLAITRLPNFLSTQFENYLELGDLSRAPYMLVFDGCHGFGTRAVELLLTPRNVNYLQRLKKKTRRWEAFQVFFKISDIWHEPYGFHKGHTITELDAVPLKARWDKVYEAARRRYDSV